MDTHINSLVFDEICTTKDNLVLDPPVLNLDLEQPSTHLQHAREKHLLCRIGPPVLLVLQETRVQMSDESDHFAQDDVLIKKFLMSIRSNGRPRF